MNLTNDPTACIRAERIREAEHERLVSVAKRAARERGKAHRIRAATGLSLIRAGLRLIGPVTP